MDNLKMHTPDLTEENYKKLAEMFPNAVTETIDEDGEVVRAIDADVLRQEISATVVEGPQERYQFNWPDKKKSVVLANQPIAKTLRLDREKSVGRDGTSGSIDTENIYIEGDNLDALKLLQETYLGKVKMIYIDPPYNTGSDSFVYDDDSSISEEEFSDRSGQRDEEGNLLYDMRVNNESNGRFHTDWLNMMYPRLRLAKDVLSNDGVIFISIDDNEVENLKKICSEIFGPDSLAVTIHCQMSTTQGMKVKAAQLGNIVKNAEYILCYTKDGHKDVASRQILYDLRPEYDEHYSLFLKEDRTICSLSDVYDYKFPKDCSNNKPLKLKDAYKKSEDFATFVRTHLENIVRSDKITGFDNISDLNYGCWKEVERDGKNYLLTLNSKGKMQQLLRLKNSWGKTDGFYEEEGLRKIRGDWWEGFYIDMGNVSKEGDVDFNNGKKPVRLILQLAKMCTQDSDIILDFFSGSATTAHAVMQLNADDEGHRKFIMVQLQESCDEKSEAYKAGYKNICELGEERIRRAGKKIKEEFPLTTSNLDIGFRTYFVDDSNMKDVYYRPADYNQGQLEMFSDNIKSDRTPEDLLFQVMLDLGILLSSRIDEMEIEGKKVFSVADGYLIACFDSDITDDVVTAIAKQHPFYAVFRDSGIASDSVMTNFEQIFETYSPKTQRKVL